MNEVRYLRQPAERRRCPPIGGRLSLPYFSSARLASPFAEIGRNPRRDRSTSAPKSVVTRAEIGPVPQVCCVLMVPRCGMRLSPSSSSCVPRRRAGQAEPDRSQCGAWWVIPGGRRLFSVLHTGATRTPAEPPHGHPTHFTRPPTPKTTPPDTTTPQTHTRPRCPDTPQPQHGSGPISARSTTDLEPEPDRSRRGERPISARLGARGWVWQGSCVNLVGG